ncbi:MAG: helix-turn-helix domain-containing protein [Pseudomonadota bacterium]
MISVKERPQGEADWAAATDLVLAVTGRAFNVQREALMSKQRCQADIAFSRQVAMYLFHIVFGGTYKQVGALFGRERTTVAYACSLVEDERDDVAFDRKLDLLEESLDRLWAITRLRQVKLKHEKSSGKAAA